MSKFAPPKKLLIEDYPEAQQEWLDTLLQPLNSFLEQTSSALTGGLTQGDNFKAKIEPLSVAVDQVYPMKVNIADLKSRPVAVEIGKFRPLDGSTPTTGCTCYWYDDDDGLKVTLFGLDATKKYEVKLLIKC